MIFNDHSIFSYHDVQETLQTMKSSYYILHNNNIYIYIINKINKYIICRDLGMLKQRSDDEKEASWEQP